MEIMNLVCFGFILLFQTVIIQAGLTKIEPNGNDLYTFNGGMIKIVCENEGSIDWWKGGTRLDPNALPADTEINTRTELGKQVSTFKKTKVVESDGGRYSCVSASQTSNTVPINVKLLHPEPEDATASSPSDSVVIGCYVPESAQNSETYTVKWKKDGVMIDNKEGKYVIAQVENNNTLEVKYVNYTTDLGVYQCAIVVPGNQNITLNVTLDSAPHAKKFHDRSKNLKLGDTLDLECHGNGYPTPELHWKKDDNDLDTSDHRITVDSETKSLEIRDLDYSDRGMYYCVAVSSNGLQSNSSIMVRVKDPLGPLWPAIGIVLEVIVLVVIIVIYEWRRKKAREQRDVKEEAVSLTQPTESAAAMELRHRNL